MQFTLSQSRYAARRRRVRPSRKATFLLYVLLLLVNVCVILACTTGGLPGGWVDVYQGFLPPRVDEPARETDELEQFPPGENWCNGSTPVAQP